MTSLRSVSYGGGVQSTALLVLAAQRRIDFQLFLFANTGDDSEHPDTLRYVRDIAMPYAAEHGIELVELHRIPKRGIAAVLCPGSGMQRRTDDETRNYCGVCTAVLDPPDRVAYPDTVPPHNKAETLWGRLHRGRMAIPVRRTKDGPPMSRSCTSDFKVDVIAKELKRRGATADNPATVGLGISVDEIERAKPGIDPDNPEQRRVYPLLDLGIARHQCAQIIRNGGLPVPPKSACFFCPFHDVEAWRSLKRNTPDLFTKSIALEAQMSAATSDGRPVYLTRYGVPLDQAIDDQLTLDGMDGCDSGWCMT